MAAFTQPTWTLEPFGKEKKPEKFENRKLGSEKTADKKFNLARNFYQNTITHYNYYFNANSKVVSVIDRAKSSNIDDYTNLIAFYPYSLDGTASQKIELDSVILSATAGILLHDLRNDWIDNMYFLIGQAYYFRKDFDSALMTFQFINYNLFPRKRKNDDDDRIVGTTTSAKDFKISIANKEKRNILQKLTAKPPSRNDAILWLARTLIEQNEFAESGGLLNTLQNDPNLPKRLQNDLEEVNAYWFFKQANYDSAAVHLEKALSTATSKQDRSRWEYLLGQLNEMNGNFDNASKFYVKASKHTVDPLLDIYARLNDAKMLKGNGDPKDLARSINNLIKMGRRDKFEAYRDIVYYSAGELALKKPDTSQAVQLFAKSLKYNESNINYKNRTFLQLGDIAYNQRKYLLAFAYYDSLQTGNDSIIDTHIAKIQDRKNALSKLVVAITNIQHEDSLQRIAFLQPNERDDYLKKLLKKLRKEKGLKEDYSSGGEIIPFGNSNQKPADLFAGNSKGEWYFYNSSLKSKGFNEFKSKWGNRPNLDNWRRKAGMEINVSNTNLIAGDNKNIKNNTGDNKSNNTTEEEITYETLAANIPLNEEKLNASNIILATNMLELARIYQNDLEEYQLAIDAYEAYLKRFPTRLEDGEVHLGLYFCYTKLGNTEKAEYYKNLINSNFANSKSAKLLNNPTAFLPSSKNPIITQLYDDIYNLFIEGNFEKAMLEKKKADSLYGVNYWTPQLLYIEALNHIKNRDDSAAIRGLEVIVNANPASLLKDKAATMIDVLRRRGEIEAYLNSLEITRATEEKTIIIIDKPKTITKSETKTPIKVETDKKVIPTVVTPTGQFTMSPSSPHYVLMVLDKVDQVYVTESRNAFIRYNRENYYSNAIVINKDAIDAEKSILVFSPFADAATALMYYDKIKKNAAAEISWLPANKYSFIIITDDNLQLLKSNKNYSEYKTLLNTQFPNRF